MLLVARIQFVSLQFNRVRYSLAYVFHGLLAHLLGNCQSTSLNAKVQTEKRER